jgi:hypothetical protein
MNTLGKRLRALEAARERAAPAPAEYLTDADRADRLMEYLETVQRVEAGGHPLTGDMKARHDELMALLARAASNVPNGAA